MQTAYRNFLLSDQEVKEYLWQSRLAGLSYLAYLPTALAFTQPAVRRVSWAWPLWALGYFAFSQLNPVAEWREQKKEETLELVYDRVGLNIRGYLEKLGRWSYVGDIDRQTRRLLWARNSMLAGVILPTNDTMPPLVEGELNRTAKVVK